jgi:hypothetical protein
MSDPESLGPISPFPLPALSLSIRQQLRRQIRAHLPGGLGEIREDKPPSVPGDLGDSFHQTGPPHPVFPRQDNILPSLQGPSDLFHFFLATNEEQLSPFI